MIALAWAETCSSIHEYVIIYNKVCVVLDGKKDCTVFNSMFVQ
jgi:hypothetical protein